MKNKIIRMLFPKFKSMAEIPARAYNFGSVVFKMQHGMMYLKTVNTVHIFKKP